MKKAQIWAKGAGFVWVWRAVCAVGCTHGYAYPARFGAVTDLSIIRKS
ncbi:MAG: hypothetical protein FWD49_05930 [Firmicutes bacterium]|nr:hypothetical protein [Bacillota bacterium]